jgi:hypothetical protein
MTGGIPRTGRGGGARNKWEGVGALSALFAIDLYTHPKAVRNEGISGIGVL